MSARRRQGWESVEAMDLSFLCIVLVLVLGGAAVAGHKFRWKTIDYMEQRIQNPTLEPPKMVKFGNRLIRACLKSHKLSTDRHR